MGAGGAVQMFHKNTEDLFFSNAHFIRLFNETVNSRPLHLFILSS